MKVPNFYKELFHLFFTHQRGQSQPTNATISNEMLIQIFLLEFQRTKFLTIRKNTPKGND